MLKIYPLIATLGLIAMGFTTLSGQVKYSNDFLAIGVGAKAQGMSNAQVASVSDVTAGYWNPAGLTQLKAPFQLGAMHAEWFAGIAQYDYLAFAKPLNKPNNAAVGLSVVRLGIDQIPNTLNLIAPDGSINYDNVTEFSAADYAVFFSYAQDVKIKDRTLSVGGSAKIIRRVIGTFGNSWGFGIDAGAIYQLNDRWRFGLMARDITSTFNAWSFTLTDQEKLVFTTTGNEVPESSLEITRPRFILGAAHSRDLSSKVSLLAEINMDFTTDGQRNVLISSSAINIDPYMGFELGYNKFIFLRGGIGNIQEVKDDFSANETSLSIQPNFGIGLRLGRFNIDYALTDIGNVSEVQYSHIFSVSLDFRTRAGTGK
ncbi:MAG: PorV/PorQ family protein [Bacteroidota bacterium]